MIAHFGHILIVIYVSFIMFHFILVSTGCAGLTAPWQGVMAKIDHKRELMERLL